MLPTVDDCWSLLRVTYWSDENSVPETNSDDGLRMIAWSCCRSAIEWPSPDDNSERPPFITAIPSGNCRICIVSGYTTCAGDAACCTSTGATSTESPAFISSFKWADSSPAWLRLTRSVMRSRRSGADPTLCCLWRWSLSLSYRKLVKSHRGHLNHQQ